MVFREVTVVEIREVLRLWLAGHGLRRTAELTLVDRKTVRRYVQAAQAAGLSRDGGHDQLDDALLGAVCERVRPARPGGHGGGWDALAAEREQISTWVEKGLSATKIHTLLARRGVLVPYRTVHRFLVAECGFGRRAATVRVADGEPGQECQVDFGRMGLVPDPVAGRRRVAHALIFTPVFSRYTFLYLTFSQTLAAVTDGCEAAWAFYGGIFRVLIPDNLSPVVADADPLCPRFTVGWLEYAQARGFVTDPARVRHAKDKPRVERTVQFARGSFFAGEDFVDLGDAQARAQTWCRTTAGLRIHGTTQARPAEVFAAQELPVLLPAPTDRYVLPVYVTPKVHRDHHVEVARSLYSVPGDLIGQRVDVRADDALVKIYHRGRLVKVHPRRPAGGRSTDAADLPAERAGYALRDVDGLRAKAAGHGAAVGEYAGRLLAVQLPWTRMRQVYRLLGLVRTHGPEAVDTACASALALDVIDVTRIARMLDRARENTPVPQAQVVGGPARFARDPAEFNPRPTPGAGR